MKANSIEDALNLFDPHRPLIEEDDIKSYYVARDNSPIEEMKTVLKTTTDFPKLLFSGPPGCGKSTELANLKEILKKDFHIIIFSIKDTSNILAISLDAMLFHILTKIAEEAKEEKLKIYSDKLEKFISRGIGWETNIEQTTTIKGGEGIEINHKKSVLDQSKKDGLEYESTLKYVYKTSSKHGADEIINLINDTIWDLEGKTKKDVLVLIADMDKIDLEIITSLFTKFVLYLTKIHCFAVYTFPLQLKFQNEFLDIYRNFNGVYYLPNFSVFNQLGAPDENGQKKLKEIISKRIHQKLIYDEAIDLIVQLSGGIVFDLINLVRQSCIIALMEKINFIDAEVVKGAEERIRHVYNSIYSDNDRKLLLKIRQTKQFINTDPGKKLFNQLSFTEYGTGDNIWYDVNPILFPLLEDIELDGE